MKQYIYIYNSNRSNKLAIVGANESINKLIVKAKSLGYETHVFAWKSGDIGEASADYFYPISIDKKEEILNVCREIGVCGIVSVTSDFAVNTVNYVARELGLVGNSEKTDLLARNKYCMRYAFKDAGIFVPEFYKVDESFDIQSITSDMYPVIVKPVDRWSSKGVTRVNSKEGLISAIEYARKESLNGEAIIESFMEGSEYSCECICENGDYFVLQITKKVTTGYPHYIEKGHIQPSGLSKDVVDKVKNTVFKALRALDIMYGAAHAEFKVLSDGTIAIIEVGARMGGDCIGTDLVALSTGHDYLKYVIDVACGNELNLSSEVLNNTIMVRFIIDEDDYNKYLLVKENQSGQILSEYDINNNFNCDVLDSSTRHGYYIIKL